MLGLWLVQLTLSNIEYLWRYSANIRMKEFKFGNWHWYKMRVEEVKSWPEEGFKGKGEAYTGSDKGGFPGGIWENNGDKIVREVIFASDRVWIYIVHIIKWSCWLSCLI